eukprot:11465241-Karenia_brevis.AAC.1
MHHASSAYMELPLTMAYAQQFLQSRLAACSMVIKDQRQQAVTEKTEKMSDHAGGKGNWGKNKTSGHGKGKGGGAAGHEPQPKGGEPTGFTTKLVNHKLILCQPSPYEPPAAADHADIAQSTIDAWYMSGTAAADTASSAD